MSTTLHRAVWMLGAVQCLYWGTVYYGFSVTLHPMARALDVSETAVAGAFSVGLLVMALAAPAVGRALDRDKGAQVMRWGAVLAIATLLASVGITSLVGVYAEWIALGIAMAMILYEPAFGLVQRAFEEPFGRVKALATVTVFGGLASTLCIPAIAWLVAHAGWRRTQIALAIVIALSAIVMERFVLPVLTQHSARRRSIEPTRTIDRPTVPWRLGLTFAMSTLAAMAISALLIAALIDRGHSPTAAAYTLALLGIMQLPGRLWVLSGRHAGSTRVLMAGPLILQAVGLALVALSHALLGVGIGVAVFGVGTGWNTLARPMVIEQLYGFQHAGRLNGAIARWQGFARAAGPLSAAATYHTVGYTALFGGTAVILAVLAAVEALSHHPDRLTTSSIATLSPSPDPPGH